MRTVDKIAELYDKWAKLRDVETIFSKPFCRQDNWAGHMVMDFLKYFHKQITKDVMKTIRNQERRIVKLERQVQEAKK